MVKIHVGKQERTYRLNIRDRRDVMEYNVNQISKGVGSQRVEEFKRKTSRTYGKLIFKPIVYVVFFVTLAIILMIGRV